MHDDWPQKQAGPGRSSSRGHGSGLWPHSPAIAFAPVSTRPPTTMPPPTPVPRITPNTTAAPAPAPSVASDSAKQFASLVIRTGRESVASRSRASGRPLSHTELAPRSRPVVRDSDPGVPTPTDAMPGTTSRRRSASATSAAIAASVAP